MPCTVEAERAGRDGLPTLQGFHPPIDLTCIPFHSIPHTPQTTQNEPHGAATWGANNRATDWNAAATDMAVELTERFPDWRGLYFIEGVTNPTVWSRSRDGRPTWWGGSVEGVWDFPIRTGDPTIDRRIVYSPHGEWVWLGLGIGVRMN